MRYSDETEQILEDFRRQIKQLHPTWYVALTSLPDGTRAYSIATEDAPDQLHFFPFRAGDWHDAIHTICEWHNSSGSWRDRP